MFAYLYFACHLSFSSAKVSCDRIVKEVFPTEKACLIFESSYTPGRGEQFGGCDTVEPGTEPGDKKEFLTLKK